MPTKNKATKTANIGGGTTMVIHELKTNKDLFQAVFDGRKTCEIRRNDRGFKVGDELWLQETAFTGEEMRNGAPLEYTGRSIGVTITHILQGTDFGLTDGYCALSFDEF